MSSDQKACRLLHGIDIKGMFDVPDMMGVQYRARLPVEDRITITSTNGGKSCMPVVGAGRAILTPIKWGFRWKFSPSRSWWAEMVRASGTSSCTTMAEACTPASVRPDVATSRTATEKSRARQSPDSPGWKDHFPVVASRQIPFRRIRGEVPTRITRLREVIQSGFPAARPSLSKTHLARAWLYRAFEYGSASRHLGRIAP